LCGKTMLYGDLVSDPERFCAQPRVREEERNRRLVEASWDEALDRIARARRPLRGRGRPRALVRRLDGPRASAASRCG
jgi:anaerobic selenocysteine-containing dehydrogenase